jgi:MarR family 2-MHQ and catechol resistance regulon transcriptional repressor
MLNKIQNVDISLFHALIHTTKATVRFVWQREEFEGITGPQFGLLMILKHIGPLSPTEISDHLLVSAPNISGILVRLKKLGFIERHRRISDRRALKIAITAKGLEKLEILFPVWKSRVEQLFSVVPAEKKNKMIAVLQEIKTYVIQSIVAEKEATKAK